MAMLSTDAALQLLGGRQVAQDTPRNGHDLTANGHDLVAGRANRQGTILVTQPRHFWPWLNRPARQPREKDRAGAWLRNAMIALTALAAAAVVVSFRAQYTMVLAFKHSAAIAYVQAGIPDAGALVFACLGIALALHGKRAVRPRALNVACVGISIAMNALAASRGWTALAVWVMAPVIYALASDTLIGVIRAWAIARQKALAEALADDAASPMAILGAALLWLLRLVLAPPSTVRGFRQWVVDEIHVAPGRTAAQTAAPLPASAEARAIPAPVAGTPKRPRKATPRRGGSTKTGHLLKLAEERHGALASIPLDQVSKIATGLAPEAGIHPASARTALLKAVRAALPAGTEDTK